jgi:hypothetical protein
MIVQEIKKKIIFEFEGLPIVMLEDKTIYHIKRKKIIYKKLNCRSVGYWIDRRFFTLSKLNNISFKSKKAIVIAEIIDCPF